MCYSATTKNIHLFIELKMSDYVKYAPIAQLGTRELHPMHFTLIKERDKQFL